MRPAPSRLPRRRPRQEAQQLHSRYTAVSRLSHDWQEAQQFLDTASAKESARAETLQGLHAAEKLEAELRSTIAARYAEALSAAAALAAAQEEQAVAKRELHDLAAELARYKSHAAIAISQRDEELQAAQAELQAADTRDGALQQQVDSLQKSLEVAAAAAEDDSRARFEVRAAEHASEVARLETALQARHFPPVVGRARCQP